MKQNEQRYYSLKKKNLIVCSGVISVKCVHRFIYPKIVFSRGKKAARYQSCDIQNGSFLHCLKNYNASHKVTSISLLTVSIKVTFKDHDLKTEIGMSCHKEIFCS